MKQDVKVNPTVDGSERTQINSGASHKHRTLEIIVLLVKPRFQGLSLHRPCLFPVTLRSFDPDLDHTGGVETKRCHYPGLVLSLGFNMFTNRTLAFYSNILTRTMRKPGLYTEVEVVDEVSSWTVFTPRVFVE